MTTIIKIRGTEAALNATPSNFGLASLVRVIETGTGNALVTQKTAGAVTIGTCTVRQGAVEYIAKAPTDTLETASATCLAVGVAFTQ